MKRNGGAGEQFSVRIYIGSEPLMTSVFSLQDSEAMLSALDGSREDVDSMFVALCLGVISNVLMLPQSWVLLGCGGILDALTARLLAEMEAPDDQELPF